MHWLYFILTLLFSIITGFILFSRGSLFNCMAGKIVQGIFSIGCFGFIGFAFWKYGWKIGALETVMIFIGGNIGKMFFDAKHKKMYGEYHDENQKNTLMDCGFNTKVDTKNMKGVVSRKSALILNTLIVMGYIAIAIFTSPWITLSAFLLFAVVIRCATMSWIMADTQEAIEKSTKRSVFCIVVLNLIGGIFFSAGVVCVLWCLGHYWFAGVKVIVACVAVFAAYQSTFPVFHCQFRKDKFSGKNIVSQIGIGAHPKESIIGGKGMSAVKQQIKERNDDCLVCPRCKNHFRQESGMVDKKYLRCSCCSFEFFYDEYEKQAKREKLGWPLTQNKNRFLSDTLFERSRYTGITKSFGEWIKWKFGHQKTVAILIIRSAIHQVIVACCRLYDLYPAIPINVKNKQDLIRFWLDPHHRFILNNIDNLLTDGDFCATEYINKGVLSLVEVRQIIDTELPHASWGGIVETYSIFKPELKGLLLAINLLLADGKKLPQLLLKIKEWIFEDGWDEYGRARKAE
jgi:hypothetical protein